MFLKSRSSLRCAFFSYVFIFNAHITTTLSPFLFSTFIFLALLCLYILYVFVYMYICV